MTYEATVFRVLIASPGDVFLERKTIADVISLWNSLHSYDENIILQPISWEKDSTPEFGNRPQEILNKQIVYSCDFLIASFWTRLGTPTEKEDSGTIEEINCFLKNKKPILLYFSSQPVNPQSVDLNQYQDLVTFKEKMQKKGLFDTYDNLYEFREKLLMHITRVVRMLSGRINSVSYINTKSNNSQNTFSLLLSQFFNLICQFKEKWDIEKEKQPIELFDSKMVLKDFLDSSYMLYPQLQSYLQKETTKSFKKILIQIKENMNRNIYLDGGKSYKDYWKKGDHAINKLLALYKSMNEG